MRQIYGLSYNTSHVSVGHDSWSQKKKKCKLKSEMQLPSLMLTQHKIEIFVAQNISEKMCEPIHLWELTREIYRWVCWKGTQLMDVNVIKSKRVGLSSCLEFETPKKLNDLHRYGLLKVSPLNFWGPIVENRINMVSNWCLQFSTYSL